MYATGESLESTDTRRTLPQLKAATYCCIRIQSSLRGFHFNLTFSDYLEIANGVEKENNSVGVVQCRSLVGLGNPNPAFPS